MATANELFAANGEDYIVIDSDLRTMTFPASINNIGVENDKDVHKLNFKMPRYFSGYDLSEFIIHINYVNANGDADMYCVLDPTVEENEIIFSWLVGRHACLYRGSVMFIVCLKLADGEGDVAQEFNTTLASLQVLPGLETEPTILETEHDVIEQLLLSINDTNAKIKAVLDTGLTPEQIAEFYNKSKTYDTQIAALNSRISDTAGFHNGIYRGKNITSYLTNGSLWNRIKGAGGYKLFEDLYLGDYITVGSNSFAIVDFDYYLRCGSADLNEHNIVMMPVGAMNIPAGTALYGTSESLTFINTANAGVTVTSQESATAFKWNATMDAPNTNSTNGGYKYSRMRTVVMKAANTIVVNAFGAAHVKPITVIYPNPSDASASGLASGWAWFNQDDQSNIVCKSICDLPNETQVYGQQIWGRGSAYTNVGYEIGTDKFQFAIFAFHRNFANYRGYWWLRSVASASTAAHVNNIGAAAYDGSAPALGARPRFLLVG